MATFAPQDSTVNGAALTMHNAAAGDKVSGVVRPTRMVVDNGTAGAVTLTIDPPGNNDYGLANAAKTYTIPVGLYELMLLPMYRDSTDSDLVSLAWSATPGATLAWAAVG